MKKIEWGVMGTAIIAVEQLIPAIKASKYARIGAIASRSIDKAEAVKRQFEIPKAYEGYDSLLKDSDIDAIYIPLPNHLHVSWAIKALQAGKHVLVEKPVALDASEARQLLDEAGKHPHLHVMEAFMYKFHPQWKDIKDQIIKGAIGDVKMIQSSFSFYDDQPDSIVYKKGMGGGSLMDVGCYPVSVARYLYDDEPSHVQAVMEYHPQYGVDIHASGIMEFEKGRSVFFSSIQMMEHQEVMILGTKGKIYVPLPFNPPLDEPTTYVLETDHEKVVVKIEAEDQYQNQIDVFSEAVLNRKKLPVSLADAVKNMDVIDALHQSARLNERTELRSGR